MEHLIPVGLPASPCTVLILETCHFQTCLVQVQSHVFKIEFKYDLVVPGRGKQGASSWGVRREGGGRFLVQLKPSAFRRCLWIQTLRAMPCSFPGLVTDPICPACSSIAKFHTAAADAVGDKLLQNKQHHELLESYDQRRDAAIAFMKTVNPSIKIRSGALTDPKVSLSPDALFQ